MAEPTVLSVTDFHKAYEGTPAVQGISFAVQPGQIIGVIGPNGAGKTTTMRALAAVIPPTSGRLTVAGFVVENESASVKQRLAYVPDDPKLFPNLTVDDHLAFTAAAYKVTDADRKASALLQQFELDQKCNTAAKDLSRGMRQKLAICCAYLYDPVALLFDEPLTGLDPMGIRTLKRTIIERAATGAGVLISSHLLAMVEDICTQILMLDHGQQQFFGTVPDLRQQFGELDDDVSLEQIFFAATADNANADQSVAVLSWLQGDLPQPAQRPQTSRQFRQC
ncbi:MAG: ABC transporter ATP-binding protein [Fuerstiella sp.]|nr:ABC transporter ATP-binding protein [Fuerstiella sp.]